MIKIQWLASIWRQNDQNIQNKAKLQKWSKSNELHRFDVKTIKMLSYVAKHTKQSETQKWQKMSCIDLTSKLSKCWGTSQNIQNNAKLQNWSNYNEFASIWRQNNQNVELLRKTFKTTQNYESDQIIMNCIDWSSKRSKK